MSGMYLLSIAAINLLTSASSNREEVYSVPHNGYLTRHQLLSGGREEREPEGGIKLQSRFTAVQSRTQTLFSVLAYLILYSRFLRNPMPQYYNSALTARATHLHANCKERLVGFLRSVDPVNGSNNVLPM